MSATRAIDLLKEARRRRVFRAAGLYIVGAWVVVQIALAIFPALGISESAIRYVWIAAVLGFPMAMAFGWRYDISGGRIVKTGPSGGDGSLSLQRADYLILASIGAVALAITVGSVLEINEMETEEQTRTASPADIDSASIAVMPFVNMSADPNNEYFSDGLTETLLHMLAQLTDLKVAARTSSFEFKGKNQDIRDIALALGVAHVLEGSVQKAGNRVRVTAQLIRAADGFHVWSQNYDRLLEDIFAIQDEIATDVASSLGSSLLATDDQGIQSIQTEDFSAYDIYLQAMEQQHINTTESLPEAERLFMAAIAKDPDFVDAKLGLARNFLIKRWKDDGDDHGSLVAAQNLIAEIREQFPDSVSAQIMELMAQVLVKFRERGKWGPNESIRAMANEMLALARQNRVDSFLTRFVVQFISGYPYHQDEEALELLSAALETDPLNFELLWAQANLLRIARRPEEARQPLLTALKLAPQNPDIPLTLGFLARQMDDYVEALEWFRQSSLLDPNDPFPLVVIASNLYQFGFLEEGDYYLQLVRNLDADSCTVASLEVESADLAGDHNRLIDLTARDLALVVSNPSFCYYPIDYYVWTMSDQARAQEAMDYLASLIPEIQDYSKVITDNRRTFYIQNVSVWLLAELMDQAAYRQLYLDYADAVFDEYPNWHDIVADVYKVSHYVLAGEPDTAEALFLENYETRMDNWRWKQFLKFPWLKEFRSDPEVAAVIDQYLEDMNGHRLELAAMLEEHEWQH